MTEATQIKKVSKMSLAAVLFNEIFARGYDLKGKTQRSTFIERAMKEQGLSKHCASTYFQNLSNKHNGQPLYKYNKNKKKAAKEVVQHLEQAVLLLTSQAKERWMVVNAEGVEVHNFKSRAVAQSFAKDNGFVWKDRNKVA